MGISLSVTFSNEWTPKSVCESQRKRNRPKTSFTGLLNDLIDEKCFHDHQNEKAVFKFDLFSNLVDIWSDLFDDDMFVKSFAALMFQAIKCNCLPWQGKPGEDGPTGPSGEEGDKVIAPEVDIHFVLTTLTRRHKQLQWRGWASFNHPLPIHPYNHPPTIHAWVHHTLGWWDGCVLSGI